MDVVGRDARAYRFLDLLYHRLWPIRRPSKATCRFRRKPNIAT